MLFMVTVTQNERKEMYLDLFENMDYKLPLKEIAEKLSVPYKSVSRDLKEFGLYEKWKVMRSFNDFIIDEERAEREKSYLERKNKYIKIIENATYRISLRDIADELYISHVQVVRDLKAFGLYEKWKSLDSSKALKLRKELYDEYYFGVKYKPTCRELGKQIGLSHTQVAKDLKILNSENSLETHTL